MALIVAVGVASVVVALMAMAVVTPGMLSVGVRVRRVCGHVQPARILARLAEHGRAAPHNDVVAAPRRNLLGAMPQHPRMHNRAAQCVRVYGRGRIGSAGDAAEHKARALELVADVHIDGDV